MSQAGIINITSGGGGGGILSIQGDDRTIVLPDGGGNIRLDGLVVANGTHSKAVFTESPSAHIENIDVQVAGGTASSDITKVGLSSFDNTVFSVDSNGFVQELQANAVIQDFDEMLSGSTQSGYGKFDWNAIASSSVSVGNGTATHPGIVTLSVAGIAMGGISPNQGSSGAGAFVLGGGSLNINFVFDIVGLSNGSNTYTIFMGFLDATSLNSGVDPLGGCYFKYTHTVNSGNWQIVTESSSVATTGNTSTAAATGFHNYGIQINAAATSVVFTINGVTVASSPLTTNIPTTPLMPAVFLDVTAGVSPVMLFDLFYYKQVLTTPR